MKTLNLRKFGLIASGWLMVTVLAMTGTSPAFAETFFFHNDHLGTPQAVTDSTQQVVWQAEYDPFGEVTETVSLVEQNLRFPGQYFDIETRLHYNYFRDYSPAIGRYVESDPIGLGGGLSTYSYALNSPQVYYDPTGEFAWFAIPAAVVLYKGYTLARDLLKLKACVANCPISCDVGDSRNNIGCKHECSIRLFGKPSGPGANLPINIR